MAIEQIKKIKFILIRIILFFTIGAIFRMSREGKLYTFQARKDIQEKHIATLVPRFCRTYMAFLSYRMELEIVCCFILKAMVNLLLGTGHFFTCLKNEAERQLEPVSFASNSI